MDFNTSQFIDKRTFGDINDGVSQCLSCGKLIIILPFDKRHGLCMECMENDSVDDS
ncbi:MAG: hypothetical protein M1481_05035 [Candidatus Thermoplasmatota archaeon]|nr:hypothetical protein [Candidatus Thermoplasmatota archaeon]MCL5964004.1 hypothetical protein [Candidatus Thermoplasmatota archaeon]